MGLAVARMLLDEGARMLIGDKAGDSIAAAVWFLCSRHASFITGANLRADGGSVAAV